MAARIYVVSDTHFGHANIYKFTNSATGKRVRPEFAHPGEADAEMVRRWNAIVKPIDHVWHLGDVAFSDAGLALVKHLNGHKRLVLGNHDKHDMKDYKAVGFEKIRGSHFYNGAWLTHIPVHQSGLYNGRVNLHGHIHENVVMKWKPREHVLHDDVVWEQEADPRYINVCVEHTKYRPVLLDSLLPRMEI